MPSLIDLTGQKFNQLTVLYQDINRKYIYWVCQCECGNIKSIEARALRKGLTKSCGCIRTPDLTNNRFGKLNVIKKLDQRDKFGKIQWECKCDCGGMINLPTGSLINHNTKSCGCLQSEVISEINKVIHTTHGLSNSPEYGIWAAMKDRCFNPNNLSYNHYGGRGITVCDRWINSFENFYADMGLRPSDQHSIDRYPDNNGHYEPGNCKWSTDEEQCNNRNNNRLFNYNNETLSLSQIAKKYNLNRQTLFSRIYSGWTIEDAINKPILGS